MKLKLIAVVMVILLLLPIVAASLASADTAEIKYTLDNQETGVNTIVKNVPFKIKAEMKVTANQPANNVRNLLLYTKTEGFTDNPIIKNVERGEWLPDAGNPDINAKISADVWQYMFTGAHGTVDDFKSDFKTLFTMNVVTSSSGQIKLDTDREYKVEGNIDIFDIIPGDIGVLNIVPADSECGDGVVGYIDENTNGIKDKNVEGIPDEVNEACDDGNINSVGCIEDCRYIKFNYKGANCGFGSRNCFLTKMTSKELLKAKLNALIDGVCYPNCEQPDAYNKKDNVNEPEMVYTGASGQKTKFVIMVGEALREFFIGMQPQ